MGCCVGVELERKRGKRTKGPKHELPLALCCSLPRCCAHLSISCARYPAPRSYVYRLLACARGSSIVDRHRHHRVFFVRASKRGSTLQAITSRTSTTSSSQNIRYRISMLLAFLLPSFCLASCRCSVDENIRCRIRRQIRQQLLLALSNDVNLAPELLMFVLLLLLFDR